MEDFEDEIFEQRALNGDIGNIVVNEGDNENDDICYALKHIVLGKEALVELVNYAVMEKRKNYSLLNFVR